jgi:hypothetical protein
VIEGTVEFVDLEGGYYVMKTDAKTYRITGDTTHLKTGKQKLAAEVLPPPEMSFFPSMPLIKI